MAKRRHKKLSPPVIAPITGLSHDGRGIAHIDGKVTFVWGALADEEVKFRYSRHHLNFDEGHMIEILSAAKQRQAAKCPHFGICAGCSLQHLKASAQIHHKQQAVLELLRQQNVVTEEILPPLQGPLWGYRRKARLSVKFVTKKNKVLVGFREHDKRKVADIEHCPILPPNIQNLKIFSDMLMQLTARQLIPQIEIAAGDEKTAIIVRHLEPLSDHDQTILIDFAKKNKFHLYLQAKGPDTIHLAWPETAGLNYQLQGLSFNFEPNSFVQVNAVINQKMLTQAIALLDPKPTDSVLDLFCGLGNFSLPLAKLTQHVTGVEGDSQAVALAKKNATANNISNVDFYIADLFANTDTQPWRAQKFDLLLLDPPRAGAKELLPWLEKWQPKKILLISCNSATLARDSGLIQNAGYCLQKVGVMDMFPHTQHIESMALFTARAIPKGKHHG